MPEKKNKQVNKKNKLTEKQKKFCKEYVLCLNATKAALNAGYSEKTAYAIGNENLKKLEIKEYIAQLRKDEEANFYYSRQNNFNELEKAQALALSREITRITKDGEIIKTPSPDLTSFIKAAELKGKLSGLYIDNIKGQTDLNINSMGSVVIDNQKIDLKIGKKPDKDL